MYYCYLLLSEVTTLQRYVCNLTELIHIPLYEFQQQRVISGG